MLTATGRVQLLGEAAPAAGPARAAGRTAARIGAAVAVLQLDGEEPGLAVGRPGPRRARVVHRRPPRRRARSGRWRDGAHHLSVARGELLAELRHDPAAAQATWRSCRRAGTSTAATAPTSLIAGGGDRPGAGRCVPRLPRAHRAGMTSARPITGTHVYSYVKCPHLAALDLQPAAQPSGGRGTSGRSSPSQARPATSRRSSSPPSAVVRRRRIPSATSPPALPPRWQLLRAGAPYVHPSGRAARPTTASACPTCCGKVARRQCDLGDFHYEVLDVKTSGRMRGDQVLQVVFYAQLLAAAAGPACPSHGGI